MPLPKKPLTRENSRPACPSCGRPIKIVDLYCRISDDHDGEGGMRSVDDQEADGRISVTEHGCCFVVGEVWKDPHRSAWNRKVVRPEFNSLMARLHSGEADGLWVYDLTRFSRKPAEGEPLIELAERGLIVLDGDAQIDLSTPRGKKQFRDGLNSAAYESDQIQKRTKRGKRLKAAKGLSNASYRAFAREGKGVAPEQVERERLMVQEVADRILARKSLGECADDMNERGFRTAKGNLWSSANLRQMLRSPALCGMNVHQGRVLEKRLPGVHALTEEKWLDLENLFLSRRRGAPATQYLLSGVVRCGKCGAWLYGRPEPLKPRYGDGEVRRSYTCTKITRKGGVVHGCMGVAVDQRELDKWVGKGVLRELGNAANAERLAELAEEGEGRRGELVERMAQRRKLAKDMTLKAGLGEIDYEVLQAFLAGHAKFMAELQAELDELDVPVPRSVAAGDVERVWDVGSLAERRGMVQEAFPDLTVRPAGRGVVMDVVDRIDWDGASLAGV